MLKQAPRVTVKIVIFRFFSGHPTWTWPEIVNTLHDTVSRRHGSLLRIAVGVFFCHKTRGLLKKKLSRVNATRHEVTLSLALHLSSIPPPPLQSRSKLPSTLRDSSLSQFTRAQHTFAPIYNKLSFISL